MILKHITQSRNRQPTGHVTPITTSNSRKTIVKSTNISPPQLQAEMTYSQFRKFKVVWDVYKRPNTNIAAQLYQLAQLCHLCNDVLKHNIVNTVANYFTLNETDILQTL